MEFSSITIRKPRKSKSLNNITIDNISVTESSGLFDTTTLSMPIASSEDCQTDDLKEKINKLTEDLQSAYLEIENLNLENSKLKSELDECKYVIKNYKKVTVGDRKNATPISSRCQKRNIQFSSSSSTPITSFVTQKGIKTALHDSISKSQLNELSSSSSTPIKACDQQENEQQLSSNSSEKKIRKNKTKSNKKKRCKKTEPSSKSDDTSEQPEIKLTALEGPLMEENLLGSSSDNKVKTSTKSSVNDNIKHSEASATHNIECNAKRKVLIVGDQQGRNTQHILQSLLGAEYQVTSFWKPGANSNEILKIHNDYQKMSKNDFIIVFTGSNDRNPFEFETMINTFVRALPNTNILMCKVPYNKCLNESKLNYVLQFICKKYDWATFIDVDYRIMPYTQLFAQNKCRTLLRDILRIDYKIKFHNYHNKHIHRNTQNNSTVDKSTQTDVIVNQIDENKEVDVSVNGCTNEEFFRT